jgi:hypothetical protein
MVPDRGSADFRSRLCAGFRILKREAAALLPHLPGAGIGCLDATLYPDKILIPATYMNDCILEAGSLSRSDAISSENRNSN